MKNNERLRKNLKSDKDQRPHKAQHGSEPIVNKSLTREGDQSPILETPFYSRMDEHAATLSRIPFTAQRQEYIMRLNNAYGLRYVQRLLESVNAQAKLTVSDPGDIYEQEADKVADEVTREINAQVQRQNQEEEEEELIQPMQDLQRQDEDITRGNQRQNMATCEACGKEYDMNETGETCPYCGAAEPLVSLRNKSIPSEGRVFEEESLHGKLGQRQEEEELVMMKRDEKTEADVTDEIEMRINSAKGSGQPLASEVKKPMEQAFGADFNDVKVHTNTEADTLNKQLNAKAFTTGTDIFFRDGEYSPGSDGGNKLIAHELTHVVQQTGRKHGEESSTKRNGRR
jgi:rubrerythrin